MELIKIKLKLIYKLVKEVINLEFKIKKHLNYSEFFMENPNFSY